MKAMTPAAAGTTTAVIPSPSVPRTGWEVCISCTPTSGGRRPHSQDGWPRRLRRLARLTLRSQATAPLTDDVELVLTELTSNALRHASSGDVSIRLLVAPESVTIQVKDTTSSPAVLRRVGPLEESGRGLFLVDALSSAWGVSDAGTTTWCRLTLTADTEHVPARTPH
ncbi:ATP-binding protein [Streptomyces luteogriseus]|uniref:ATP-binding protein n=1 Tax=Streptomyces luteogriseus TaxID=68233 RepID=UPI002E335CAF|nr:ATP-binding protein [Streptomyces luteogriseus]WTJ25624.1 ATP-binding protein [Streptomyces luteogriseus]